MELIYSKTSLQRQMEKGDQFIIAANGFEPGPDKGAAENTGNDNQNEEAEDEAAGDGRKLGQGKDHPAERALVEWRRPLRV